MFKKIKPKSKVTSNKEKKQPGLGRWKIDFQRILRIMGEIPAHIDNK